MSNTGPSSSAADPSSPASAGVIRSATAQSKAELRARIRKQLALITVEERQRASMELCRALGDQEIWRKASSVLAYAPRSDELDISPLLDSAWRSGKLIALPQYNAQARSYEACRILAPVSELRTGYFGIREPGLECPRVLLNQLDLILVPGLAFDLVGHRLGRGRGFYDALLAGVLRTKCGLCFDEQLQPEIPVESHDVLLDCILTPSRWLDFRPRRCGR